MSDKPTTPLYIYDADHGPIRLLAELHDVSPADVVHLAVHAVIAGRSLRREVVDRVRADRAARLRDLAEPHGGA